jgi:hypothetical protein
MQPWVIVVPSAVVLLFAWTALRSPRPPDWWRTDRRRRRQ